MPLILGTDGAKLSKRHGGVSVEEYKREGFLPEALANYLFLLGWMPKDGREILPPGEAVRLFEISEMNAVQAKFDLQKLRWINGEYIMKAPDARLVPLLRPHLDAAGTPAAAVADDDLAKVLGLYRIRIKTLSEFPPMTDCFFREDFAVEEEGEEAPGEAREPRVSGPPGRPAGRDHGFLPPRDRGRLPRASPRSAASRSARSSTPPAWPSAARPRARACSR